MSQLNDLKNNRDRIIALIDAGGATKSSIMSALSVTDKTLASTFAQLRLMGKFPTAGDDGVYLFITEDEFNAKKAARVSNKPAKVLTPEQSRVAAQKREDRAAKTVTSAEKRYAENDSRENELRLVIAKAELELSSILLGSLGQEGDDLGTSLL